jgi:hypothetical protein
MPAELDERPRIAEAMCGRTPVETDATVSSSGSAY